MLKINHDRDIDNNNVVFVAEGILKSIIDTMMVNYKSYLQLKLKIS